MLSVFFVDFFRENVPLHFAVFQSSVCLSFFFRRVFQSELWNGSPGFLRMIFVPKMPILRPENGEKRSSPFLRFFLGVLLLLRRVFAEGFWATNSVICIGGVFVWFWVRVSVWIYLSE